MIDRNEDPRGLVFRLVAEVLERDASALRGSDRLREDLGLDSLGSLELLSSLEHVLALEIEPEDAMGLRTVDDACAFVVARLAAREGANGARAS